MLSLNTRGQATGSSLVEVVIATALLGLIFIGATEAVGSQGPFALSTVSRSALQTRSSIACRTAVREVSPGNITNAAVDGTTLTYQRPVDPDGDGLVLDNLGNIQWGMTLNGVDVAGATGTFLYVVDDQLDEGVLGVDLNLDGDQADVLDRGHLERQLSNGQTFRVSGSWILQPAGNHGGDLNGDLVADPIFQVINAGDGRLLQIDLTSVSPVNNTQWTTVRSRSTVSLRNSN